MATKAALHRSDAWIPSCNPSSQEVRNDRRYHVVVSRGVPFLRRMCGGTTSLLAPYVAVVFLTSTCLLLSACGGGDPLANARAENRLAVSDLAVVSAGKQSATLQFREVDDGTGAPASYDIRYARSPLGSAWGSARSVDVGTCKIPVAGARVGQLRSCTVEGLEPGRRYDFQLVPFRGTMNQDAVYGPLSNIATGHTTEASVRIEVLPPSATLQVGGELRVRAKVTDRAGNVLERPVAWSSSRSSVASVSGSDSSAIVRGLNPGDTDIRATVDGVHGIAEVRVVRRASSSAARPNEPSGFGRLAEHNFSCRPSRGCAAAGQWGESDVSFHRSNLSIVERPDAPAGGRRVVRTRFPRGLRAGVGPVSFWGWSAPGREYRAIYISKWIRIDGTDYENHPGITKLGWIGYGQRGIDNQGFLSGQTTPGTGRVEVIRHLQPSFRQQNHVDRAEWGSGRIRVGEWQHWEILLELNNLGRRNGVFKWWINETLVLSKSDMVFITRGNERGFFSYRWNPTWGGVGDFAKSRDDFIDIAHIYISGRR